MTTMRAVTRSLSACGDTYHIEETRLRCGCSEIKTMRTLVRRSKECRVCMTCGKGVRVGKDQVSNVYCAKHQPAADAAKPATKA